MGVSLVGALPAAVDAGGRLMVFPELAHLFNVLSIVPLKCVCMRVGFGVRGDIL